MVRFTVTVCACIRIWPELPKQDVAVPTNSPRLLSTSHVTRCFLTGVRPPRTAVKRGQNRIDERARGEALGVFSGEKIFSWDEAGSFTLHLSARFPRGPGSVGRWAVIGSSGPRGRSAGIWVAARLRVRRRGPRRVRRHDPPLTELCPHPVDLRSQHAAAERGQVPANRQHLTLLLVRPAACGESTVPPAMIS